jgi:hypothetical protein
VAHTATHIEAAERVSVHALDGLLKWQVSGSLVCNDQEEPDEGDDVRALTLLPGLLIPGDLPSLIPASLIPPEPPWTVWGSPSATLIRLRC